MKTRRITAFACALATVVLIAGVPLWDQIQRSATPQIEDLHGEISIGVVLPLTGGLAAPYGLPMQRGFELAREQINNSGQLGDVKITFITEDDQGTVEDAVEAYNKLIHQDGVPVILGPANSSQVREAFPIAQQNRVVAISSLSSASGLSAIGDFNFRISLTTDVLVPSGIRITQEKLGYTKAATIYDEIDLYSTDSSKVVREAFIANGVEILTTETYQTGETDFSAQLTRIKESNPDAIFISALVPEMIKIMTQARQLGIPTDVPLIVPDLTGDEVDAAGDAAEGAITFTSWASTVDTPGNRAFVQNYRAKYEAEPNPWAAQSYAALYILAEAIANAQSTDATAIRKALANTKNFDTVLGEFSFNAAGDAVYDLMVLVVQNGNFEVFE
ncbi:ABC transporter substrate-binding protein [Candidatus Poribacteria bacterium]|nr:ABC transporter substrate-binding protein [Candidatus Poribacteria bacterium]